MRAIDDRGLRLIKLFEGFSPIPYLCQAGVKTIGFGHAILPGESFGNPITEDEGNVLLQRDLGNAQRAVDHLIYVPLSILQFDAIVSFTYNLGAFALQRSTLRSRLNRGEYTSTAEEFPKWIWAGGRKSAGLLRRRCAERGMFLSGIDEELDEDSE